MTFYKLFFTTVLCGALQNNYAMEQELAKVKFEGQDPSYAVYEAVKAGKLASVIEYINVRNAAGTTALHRAVRDSNKEMVELLLNNGAKVDIKNKEGLTALSCAVERDNNIELIELIEFLIVYGGADVNTQNKFKCGLSTPLHQAAWRGNKERVALLLKHGAKIDSKDSQGRTPVFAARSKEVIDILIAHDAQVNALDAKGNTPLHMAAKANKEGLALRIAYGAEVNAQNNKGKTALHKAAKSSNLEAIEMLIACGADINAQDSKGNTPLHRVLGGCRFIRHPASRDPFNMHCIKKLTDIVDLIVGYGVQPDCTNMLGETALSIAQKRRCFIDIENILKYYSDLKKEIADSPTFEVLLKVIGYGDYPKLVQKLLSKGVKPTQEELDLAEEYKKRKIGKVLKTYLGIIGSNSTISKTGIRSACNLNMPEEIAALIAAYAVAE
jgi:ankyrin repeat protein